MQWARFKHKLVQCHFKLHTLATYVRVYVANLLGGRRNSSLCEKPCYISGFLLYNFSVTLLSALLLNLNHDKRVE